MARAVHCSCTCAAHAACICTHKLSRATAVCEWQSVWVESDVSARSQQNDLSCSSTARARARAQIRCFTSVSARSLQRRAFDERHQPEQGGLAAHHPQAGRAHQAHHVLWGKADGAVRGARWSGGREART